MGRTPQGYTAPRSYIRPGNFEKKIPKGLRTFYIRLMYNVRMAFTKLNFRCTYAEEERWKEAARKTGRSLSAWIRWLANTASESPILDRVSVAGDSEVPFPVASAVAGKPVAAPRYVVKCERDWDTGLPVVTVDGDEVVWEGEKSAFALRQVYPSSVVNEIRKQCRELN